MRESRNDKDSLVAFAPLGHEFTDPALLGRALTHRSAANHSLDSNERLEFLGDRVLGLVVAGMLYRRFPKEPEGALAKRFVALVRKETLADIAASLDLERHLRLDRGERDSANPGRRADALEAVLGAIFLDGGFEAAERFIRTHWQEPMEATAAPPRDAKTTLQEWAQGRGLDLPTYEVTDRSGPPHSPTFTVEARVEGLRPRRGTARSKRQAEQEAASAILTLIEQEP